MTDTRHTMWVCATCGAEAAHWTEEPLPVEFREGTYLVNGFEYERCDACGETVVAADQLDAVLVAGVAAAREHLGRLSSDDIHALRHDLGLTQAQLEEQLGVGRGTVGRWERGTVLQGATADRFMRVLWAHPELLAELGYVAREGKGPYRTRK